jgi:hypothetical protein
MPAPAGFHTVWTLRKQDPERSAVYTVAHAKSEDARCTCPDHEINGATCKHVMALAALGLIKKPRAARPKPASTARIRKAHAKNARAPIAEVKALDPQARRHLAEITTSDPVARSHIAEGLDTPQARAAFRKDVLIRTRGAAAQESFTAGMRAAVADALRRIHTGEQPFPSLDPAPQASTCDGCGREFDPEESRDPHFCEDCREGGAS